MIQHRDNWVDNTYIGTSADGTVSPKEDAMAGFDERDVRLPNWDVSALYQVDPNVSLYARATRGFRGPTIQGR